MEKGHENNGLKKEEIRDKIKKLLEDEGLNQEGDQNLSPDSEKSSLGLGCGICCC